MDRHRFRSLHPLVLMTRWLRAIYRSRIWRFVCTSFLVLTLIVLSPGTAYASLAITATSSTSALQASLQKNNVTVSNIIVNEGTNTGQIGTFSGGLTGGAGPTIGIEDGVAMITGPVTAAIGPNNSYRVTTGSETGPTDANLATVDSGTQFDTATLQFDVVPAGNFLAMDFVFGSDEYNEYVCTRFNDAMGIFVTGPTISGVTNIARLSSTLKPIAVNNINRGIAGIYSDGTACDLSNSDFYVKNLPDAATENTAFDPNISSNFTNLQFDGFTTPLTALLKVNPGATYTIKAVIADIGDAQWDSGLFIDGVRSFNLDLGDAPDSYGTQPIDQAIQLPGPARHSTGLDIYLGTVAPDAENTVTLVTSPNPANADDLAGTDDEDAFSGDLNLVAGVTTHSITNIPVRNGIGSTAKLMGWIDFNKDGDFFDAGELAAVDVAPGATTANLNWSGFTAPTVGTTYARFRITTDPDIINSPTPVNLARDGEVEDYRVVISGLTLTGQVFEDVNYGGGSGRSLTAANGVVRPNVRVELYSDTGNYLGKTFTDTNGQYQFNTTNIPTLAPTNTYQVRVINGFVTSSRTGACALAVDVDTPPAACSQIPVQTFRTNGLAANIGVADASRVGGEKTAEVDSPANTSNQTLAALNAVAGQEVESLTSVTFANAVVTGIDFGFNFDTIVNTNDSGQGSLRQFVINSNALANTGLDQVANSSPAAGTTAIDPPAGQETSIFMIPSGSDPLGRPKDPNFNAGSGVAAINFTSNMSITSNFTNIDARTQTANIGNTNSGKLGVGATATYRVGTGADGVENTGDEPILAGVEKPEVQIQGQRNAQCLTISSTAADVSIRGLAIYGCTDAISLNNTTRISVESNVIGSTATSFADPGVGIRNRNQGIGIWQSSYVNVNNNLIGFNGGMGIWALSTTNNVTIQNNEVRNNAYEENVGGQGLVFDGIEIQGSNNLVSGNLSTENFGNAIDNINGVTGNQFINNTLENSGLGFVQGSNANPEGSGIRVFGSDQTIKWNVIRNNRAPGLLLLGNAQRNRISQNAIYRNAQLGIDLRTETTGFPAISAGASPYVSANDGAIGVGANNGFDYPIITSATLSSGNLAVRGFVGNVTTGTTTFGSPTVEIFVADDDGDNAGRVFVADAATVSMPHGEGKTYIGSCATDSNGLFGTVALPCIFTNVNSLGLTNANNITATATDINGNTSEFSSQATSGANVLLVKRITAINGLTVNPNDSKSLTGFVDDATSANDNNANWPAGYLQGAIDGGLVKVGDEVEYTIYFLNAGGRNAKSARICDEIKPNQSFQTNKYGTGQGIKLKMGTTTELVITNGNDANTDRGQYIAAPGAVPTNCNFSNTNGAITVDLAGTTGNPSLSVFPYATGVGTPNDAYGYVRFTTKVQSSN